MGANLGQHFLDDKEVLADIVAAGDISDTDTILEIGPGEGVLTEKLLKQAEKVVAVEKDPGLFRNLKSKFRSAVKKGGLEVIQSDIRDLNLRELIDTNKYKVMANIPYYLTGQLIKKTLTSSHQPEHIVFLVQKEVAERIIAEDGKESKLSLSVKAFGEPEMIRSVPPESFTPPPEVDSAILVIKNISRDFFTDTDEEAFFALIKRGFSHKRKKLSNNLSTNQNYEKGQIEDVLERFNINPDIRAEKLRIYQWKKLLGKLEG